MNNFKRAGSFLSVYLMFILLVGSVSLPTVFAYEEGDVVSIDQVKSEISSEAGTAEEKTYVEDEVLVKYKNNKINLATFSGKQTASNFIQAKSLEQMENLEEINTSVLKITDDKTVEEKITELENDPNVEYVQPNYQYYPSSVITSNDTYKDRLWALANSGQTVNGFTPAAPGADISAPQAWVISEALPSTPVIVAVIDSGVAYNHPDLFASMWDGTNCKDENGVLLAGGCNHGYDYEDNDNTPLPTGNSHGTHIAGIIAAEINNSKGVIGVAPHAKIMAIKSSLTTANIVKAITFAQQNGAKVINASWNCYGSDQGGFHSVCAEGINYQDAAMKNAIDSFPGLFVTVAGNGDGDTDDAGDNHDADQTLHTYPCDYTAPNIICVAATDQNDELADFSDFGTASVDVAAPGTNIYGAVADTIMGSEDFGTVSAPNIPNGWTTSGTNNNWGTYILSGSNVLYGDLSSPSYAGNADTTISSPSYDLSGSIGATIDFGSGCDTEYSTTAWTDYMQVNYSSDGVNFVPVTVASEILRWDEPLLDLLNGDANPSGGASYYFSGIPLPGPLTENSKVQFAWHTNGDLNHHDGCWVDDIVVTKYSDGADEKYAYLQGTSMATPHVTGLAALIWGAKPNLTSADVKNTILNTGDSLNSLNGKILTGKRINAFSALKSVTLPVPTNVQVASTTATSTKITWSTDLPATSKVVYGTTSPSSVIVDNTPTMNHVVVLTGLSASTTYSFYAESGDQYGNIASSTPQSFQTSAVVAVVVNAPYSQSITLSPGWNIVSTPRLLASHIFSAPETLSNFSIVILDASRPSGWATMSELGQTEFMPLYGYFINNKTATSQVLTLNYRAATEGERSFNRSFTTSGWYSFGIANPAYAKIQGPDTTDINNPDNILHSLLGATSNYDSVVDFTDASFFGNPNSVALSDPWKIVTRSNDPANTTEINSLNDFRETKGYAVYIKAPTALSGSQEGTTPECIDSVDNDGDGLVDYPLDNGCVASTDNSESPAFSETSHWNSHSLGITGEYESLAWNGDGYGATYVWGNKIHFAKLDTNGNKLSEKIVATVPNYGFWTNIVWDGTKYGIVWPEANPQNIRFATIDIDGNILSNIPITLGSDNASTERPALLWTGSEYILTWSGGWPDGSNNSAKIVYFTKISSNGETILTDKKKSIISGNVTAANGPIVSMAWNGTTFGIVWQDIRESNDSNQPALYFSVLNSNGDKLIDDIKISGSGRIYRPSIFSNGENYDIFWREVSNSTDEGIYFTKVSATGTKQIANKNLSPLKGDETQPTVTKNNDGYGVVWLSASKGNLYLKTVSTSGDVLTDNDLVNTGLGQNNNAYLIFASSRYGIIWSNTQNNQLQLYFGTK
jgi:subtilisin family serine protease